MRKEEEDARTERSQWLGSSTVSPQHLTAPAATAASSALLIPVLLGREVPEQVFLHTDLLISFCQLTVWLLNHWEDLTPSCESAQCEEQSSWPQQMINIYLPACQGSAISSRQKETSELMRVTGHPVEGKNAGVHNGNEAIVSLPAAFPECLTTLWSGNRACQQMHEANRQLQTGPLCHQPWHILLSPQG